jgi:hypothetical protein
MYIYAYNMLIVYLNWCVLVKAALCCALQLLWCALYNRWKPTAIVWCILNSSSVLKSIKFINSNISPLFKLVLKIYLIITTLSTFLFLKSLFRVVRKFPVLYANTYIIAVWRGLASGPYPKQVNVLQTNTPYIRRYGSQLRYHRRGSFPKDT